MCAPYHKNNGRISLKIFNALWWARIVQRNIRPAKSEVKKLTCGWNPFSSAMYVTYMEKNGMKRDRRLIEIEIKLKMK